MSFIHLHNHSHYSLLEGLSKVDEMIDLAKSFGMSALALTDHGNMYGAIEFYKKCKAAKIKPIIGVEFYLTPGSLSSKQPQIDTVRNHLVLLAKNEIGYKNLIQLVTKSYIEGFYYKPRIDEELLKKHTEGLVCLSGDSRSELSRLLSRNDMNKANVLAQKYKDFFGDDYYLEIMYHPNVDGDELIRKNTAKLSEELSIPLMAGQSAYYLHSDDKEAHSTLLAIQQNVFGRDRALIESDDFSFIDPKTAKSYFRDYPEALENTVKIAEKCNLEIPMGSWIFPNFEIPDGSSPGKKLREITYKGLDKRKMSETEVVTTRIDYELDIIEKKGFSKYILVVADLISFANKNNIYHNIRGSVAGSLVTYLTGITKVDPLHYKLPFERFLNPERPTAPDIDMDFADNRRDEVIEYAKKKYGEDKVAQIGTFGTMLARGVVRDVARALDHPYNVGDRISKMIPLGSQGFPMTIDRALSLEPELKRAYKNEPETKKIIDLGKKLEGCVRHVSVHAAGVVIAPTPLTDYTPLQLDPKGGKTITQYDMYTGDGEGVVDLPKFDFLGIKNLSILADAVHRVKKIRDIDIDIDKIPLDDKKTFEMLARGETLGLFQLGGAAMTRHLKDLRPSSINDINAMVALYRPGPMDSIPEYIRRKHDPSQISFLDERMKDILDQSYGVITYQDDVMMIAIKLAGYSWLLVVRGRPPA